MHARPLSVLLIATVLIVSIWGVGVAEAQLDTGESYWGEHMINDMFHLWPAVAIAILAGVLAGRVFGFYELNAVSMLFLLAATAFLAYHFYWQPAHAASVLSPDFGRLRSPRIGSTLLNTAALQRESGARFDPKLAAAFCRIVAHG